jgi:hypothetical protein
MEFQTDTATVVDTSYWLCLEYNGPVCTDSQLSNQLNYDFTHIDTHLVAVGSIDTVGTLCGGWPTVDGRSLTQTGQDLKVGGVAYTKDDPLPTGFAPQQGGLLVKILADVFDIPDTLQDRTVNLQVIYQPLENFSFSRLDGSSIGITHFTVPDTNCWICTVWIIPDEVCGNWERVSIPPPGGCDSIDVVLDTVPMIDTNTVTIFNGSLTVLTPPPYICGNVDGVVGFGGPVDVGDLTYLVAFLFQGGPEPQPMEAADMDCDPQFTIPNVADLTYLVSYLFQGGAAPCNGC